MDVQVTCDIVDTAPVTPAPATTADRPETRAVRRFEIDPASSPMLLAALAWDRAPRR